MDKKYFPILDKYAVNLSKLAEMVELKSSDKPIDEYSLKRIMYVTRRRVKNSPIILSDSPSLIDRYVDALVLRLLQSDDDIPETIIGVNIFKLNWKQYYKEDLPKIISELIPVRHRTDTGVHQAILYVPNCGDLFQQQEDVAKRIRTAICRFEFDSILGMSKSQYEKVIIPHPPTDRKTETIYIFSAS